MIILPTLPYEKNALEPYISSNTLDFHYDKHHAGYVSNLNKLIQGTEFEGMFLTDIITKSNNKVEYTAIFNNAAQVWNHTFYWNSMKKNPASINDELLKKIVADFDSLEKLKEGLLNASISQFGSGWAWLVINKDSDKLEIIKTSNAFTPIADKKYIPLLTIDVWEHAYYLDYQNQRVNYVKAIIDNILNWEFAYDNFMIEQQI